MTDFTSTLYRFWREDTHEKSEISLLPTFCYPFPYFLDNILFFSRELIFADDRFREISYGLNFTFGKFCDISRGSWYAEKVKVREIRNKQYTKGVTPKNNSRFSANLPFLHTKLIHFLQRQHYLYQQPNILKFSLKDSAVVELRHRDQRNHPEKWVGFYIRFIYTEHYSFYFHRF